jgi:hypothetical protein
MRCPSCNSNYQTEFAAEMIIHLSGMENLDQPGVWVFPMLSVCLDCGFSGFIVPKTELPLLADRAQPHKAWTLKRRLEFPAFDGGIALRKGT